VDGRVAGVLLAAGAATRFGADKLLHPLADGTPIAARSARVLAAALPASLAVVREAQSDLARLLRAEGLTTVVCPAARSGMGASLGCGVGAAPDAAGWVICLADMPFVRASTIAAVAQALRDGAAIAAPFHAGRRGHPVGFDRRFRDALQGLDGDAGARGLLAAHSGQVVRIDTDDAGVLADVDRPGDLAGMP
jgi:molybdenum cofactor cytidylyltransferase